MVAQEATVVSLDEALRMFAANSLELRAARARSDEAAGSAFAAEHTRSAEAARLVSRWQVWWPDLPWGR